MATDESLPASAADAAHVRVDPTLVGDAIRQYRERADELRRNAGWGSMVMVGALRTPAAHECAASCAKFDRLSGIIAGQLDDQANKLQAYLDARQDTQDTHVGRLDQAGRDLMKA